MDETVETLLDGDVQREELPPLSEMHVARMGAGSDGVSGSNDVWSSSLSLDAADVDPPPCFGGFTVIRALAALLSASNVAVLANVTKRTQPPDSSDCSALARRTYPSGAGNASASGASAESQERATTHLPGRKTRRARSMKATGSSAVTLAGTIDSSPLPQKSGWNPLSSTLAYEKSASGVTWIVESVSPSSPFIEYPHGSNTKSSISAFGKSAEMPLRLVVVFASTNAASRSKWAAASRSSSVMHISSVYVARGAGVSVATASFARSSAAHAAYTCQRSPRRDVPRTYASPPSPRWPNCVSRNATSSSKLPCGLGCSSGKA
mmetsp:Transcript_29249/g.95316  ORF Transcript_29249/g.95316 Transcript_29249/m.95316 type:complete len:322 (+) Transcript_29249:654-1619(+)